MIRKLPFDELVDAVDALSADDQKELLHLIRCRLAERERHRVVADVGQARTEIANGQARLLNLAELFRDLER